MSDRLKIRHVLKRSFSVSQNVVCDTLISRCPIRAATLVIKKSGAVERPRNHLLELLAESTLSLLFALRKF